MVLTCSSLYSSKVNPFRDRMMAVFSTYEDFLTFEDYLDMMSVLSVNAPLDLKAEYAFRIYGMLKSLITYFF